MQVVNIKDLKSRLSAYLREVARGEVFLVTDRNRVVAQLGPVGPLATAESQGRPDVVGRLVSIGARPPQRPRRPSDYQRAGPGSGLTTAEIDDLLRQVRAEDR